MNFSKYFLAVTLLVILACCDTKQGRNGTSNADAVELSGTLMLSGAYALAPVAGSWAESFMALHPGVKVIVNDNTSIQGLEDLRAQKCQLALISRPLTDEEIITGIWTVPVAKDGVATVVNETNPYLQKLLEEGLSTDEFRKVFISGEEISWGELLGVPGKEMIKPFARISGSGASDVWAGYLYSEPDHIKGTMMESDIDLINAVATEKYAIGFCNFSHAYNLDDGKLKKGIHVIPFDLDFDNDINNTEYPFESLDKAHRALWLGLYPKVLCRNLLLAAEGTPDDKLVIEFIRYVLTEGQKTVTSFGLCELNNVHIRNALEDLERLPGAK